MMGKKLSVAQTKKYKKELLLALELFKGVRYKAYEYLRAPKKTKEESFIDNDDVQYGRGIKITWDYYLKIWLVDDVAFATEYEYVMDNELYFVENQLHEQIKNGNFQAIKFYLERIHKNKYSEKIETDNKHSGDITVNIITGEDGD